MIAILLFSANSALGQTLILDQIKQKLLSGQRLQADVSFLLLDSFTLDRHESKGTILIASDAYRVNADGRTILVDGETSRVYTEAQNQVIISPYNAEEDDYAPSRFLTGVSDDYTLKEQKVVKNNTVVKLESSSPFALFKTVELTIETKSLLPVKFVAVDQTDNINETYFSKARFTVSDGKPMQLSYPDDAEIIDLRK